MLPVLYFGGRFLGIFTDFSNQKEQEEEFDYVESAAPDAVVIDQDEIDWSNAIKGSARYNENVVNILLLGEDGQSDQDYRGNSDTMIIFTINKEKKTVKMTSIMRDLSKSNSTNRQKALDNENNRRAIAMLKVLVIQELSLSEMARRLNEEGFVTSQGKPFTAWQVSVLLKRYNLKS